MIKFGTSGWRGIIGEDFTFDNVRIASQGVANYLKSSGQKGSGVVVAFDTRFLSEKFALEASKILAYNGIKAFLSNRDVPTPCVSFETVRRKAMGAINFTASHNPRQDNGYKVYQADGAQVIPPVDGEIEQLMAHAELPDIEIAPPVSGGRVESVMNFCTPAEYLEFMRQTPEVFSDAAGAAAPLCRARNGPAQAMEADVN